MTDVRATSNINNDYTQTGTAPKKEAALFGNQSAASVSPSEPINGNGSSKVDPNVKNKRLAKLKSNLLDDYKITLEQFNYIVKTALNMSEEDIFSCDDKKFESIVKLIIESIDNLKTEDTKNGSVEKEPSERVEDIAAKLKDLYENNDKSVEKTREVVKEVGTLLDAVKKFGGKEFEKYKSIKEIPVNKLAAVFKKINNYFKDKKNSDKTENALKTMQNLLITATKEEREHVIRATIRAFETSDVGQYIIKQIKNCKSKEEFHKLVENSDIMKAIANLGFSTEEVAEILDNMYSSAKHFGIGKDKITSSLTDLLDKRISRIKELEDKKQKEGLSEKEQQEYDDLMKKGKDGVIAAYSFAAGLRAKIAEHDPNGAKRLDEILEEGGCKDDVYRLIAEYAKKYPDKEILKYMDESTGGEFSRDYGDIVNSGESSGEYSASESGTGRVGLGYDIAPQETMLAASQNLENKKSELANTEVPMQYTIEKPEKTLESKMVETREGFTAYAKTFGWKKAAVEAGKHFQNVSQDVKSAVKSYAANMFKNDKGLMGFADDCRNNTALVKGIIAPKIQDGENIAKLGVDIGTKQVLKNAYDEEHKNEEEKKEEQV